MFIGLQDKEWKKANLHKIEVNVKILLNPMFKNKK